MFRLSLNGGILLMEMDDGLCSQGKEFTLKEGLISQEKSIISRSGCRGWWGDTPEVDGCNLVTCNMLAIVQSASCAMVAFLGFPSHTWVLVCHPERSHMGVSLDLSQTAHAETISHTESMLLMEN